MSPEEQIDSMISATFESLAPEILADLQQSLSIAYPPSSKPGEYPHLRSGDLRSSASAIVMDAGGGPILVVSTSMLYSRYLEEGTPHMAARPHMAILAAKWGPIVAERFHAAFAPSGAPSSNPTVPADSLSMALG